VAINLRTAKLLSRHGGRKPGRRKKEENMTPLTKQEKKTVKEHPCALTIKAQ
jgi:hypothetical protein